MERLSNTLTLPALNFNKYSTRFEPINPAPPVTKKEYFDKFTIKETALSRDQYLESLIGELSWWQTISIAVLDLGSAKVNEIHEHEFIRVKEKLSSSKNVKPTIWSSLQSHTVMDCTNVNVTVNTLFRIKFMLRATAAC